MRFLHVLILITGLFFTRQQPGPKITRILTVEPRLVEIKINHAFGEQIDIAARFVPGQDISNVVITIETESHTIIARETLLPSSSGGINFTHMLSQHTIPVFSVLSIWFEVEMSNGSKYTFQPESYVYDDNRFQWQTLQNGGFTVFWYQQESTLGQQILTTAYEGLSRINNLVDVPPPDSIKIYAYASVADLQDTLKFSGEASTWIAGHAEPHLGTIAVSLPPGPEQILEIRRQIPHELVHILLYQKLGDGYRNLPSWLNEGLASSAELFPNPDYQLLLDNAYERDALLPIQDLCQNFPIDAANFQLAYAEAFGFTWYLQETYGKEMMENLVQAYGQGQDCSQGVQSVFGKSLLELEKSWRQAAFLEPPGLEISEGAVPLMILVGFAFIVPLGLIIKGIGKRSKD